MTADTLTQIGMLAVIVRTALELLSSLFVTSHQGYLTPSGVRAALAA